MPYKVEKRGSSWVVKKKDGSKIFGHHPSKAKAEAQMRAIYANEGKK